MKSRNVKGLSEFFKNANELLDILTDLDEDGKPKKKLPNCPKCKEDKLEAVHSDLLLCKCGWKIEGRVGTNGGILVS